MPERLSLEQCRAARGWLGWSQEELATKARVSVSTIRDFEAGRRVPFPNNLRAIQHALEETGMRFLYENHTPVGVAMRHEMPPIKSKKRR
jgi:transcriptional regulator with XRE-family HTH domain